jgi:hypothetical protein
MGSVGSSGQPMTWDADQDPFTKDLLGAIMPYLEGSYRISKLPRDSALPGQSMGGIQPLNIGLTHEYYGDSLRARAAKLKLLYYVNGETDTSVPNARGLQGL